MIPPRFEPQPDNTFRIVHSPLYYSKIALLKKIAQQEISDREAIPRLKEALGKYPWQFQAAYVLAQIYTRNGEIEKACNTRFKAFQRIMQALPEDDEPMELDWEYLENQYILMILHDSAIDHYLAGDFEMAAGMIETLLDLDEEDHFEAIAPLAFCYIALGERESFELVCGDMNDKNPDKIVARLWAEQVFDGALHPESVEKLKKEWPAVWKEFRGDDHEPDAQYLLDIEEERPAERTRARHIWLRTEHLWSLAGLPALPDALKAVE